MSVTMQLYGLFMTDKKIRGLRSRLDQAERFLKAQIHQLGEIEKTRDSTRGQQRQLQASIKNNEVEVAGFDAHIEELRERMNTAGTNKEYKATLTEVNTFKEKKSSLEEEVIKQMEQVDALNAQVTELETAHADREKVKAVAEQDRTTRSEEIAGTLAELQAKREQQAKQVSTDALGVYEQLLDERGEDAMAPLEILDAKRHEYVCGSSMMAVPVETAISLLSGKLTLSPNNGCILYLEPEVEERLLASTGKK
ncbi:MAG: putative nucleic acid-binding Zn-ribbon protein [Phycisphaerales bacterium]|jgi:predicted  nucleic acid-binding Zn-ribbon protein